MKILFIITSLNRGGAERVVIELANYFINIDIEVKIVYLTGIVSFNDISSRIEIIPLNLTNLLNLPKALFQVIGIIKNYNPDIVHAHMVHAIFFSRIARIFVKMNRLINTAHNTNDGGLIRRKFYKYTNFLSDLFTNVSTQAANAFYTNGCIKNKADIKVIYNPIQTEKFLRSLSDRSLLCSRLGIDPKNKILLSVGRLKQSKDYFNLFSMLGILKDSDDNFIQLIAGEGNFKEVYKDILNNLSISKKIIFLGERNDVDFLMSASDVFILSSAWEGMPLVIGEAMASGMFVVSTDCGGVDELLGELGYLVPIKDPVALAKATLQAMELSHMDLSKYRFLARERIVYNFSISTIGKQWLEIYRTLLI